MQNAESIQKNIAWATVPETGGTYRFFQLLRKAVEPLGWRVWGVSVGCETLSWNEPLADEFCVKVGRPSDSFTESVKTFIDWTKENNIDIVMPVGSSIMSSAMPHLPSSVKLIMQGNNITRHTYATTLVNREYVSHYIGISQRHYDDLINRYKVSSDEITLIPHALELKKFSEAAKKRRYFIGDDEKIKIAFLGRLINADKGVFLIPEILDRLRKNNIPFCLKIAGDGVDRVKLEKKLDRYVNDGSVQFVGSIRSYEVPFFLSSNDIFLMPSNFEGFGFTLIEAMASGCVPIVSSIRGVTDWIVKDRTTGMLCPIGDANIFYEKISMLYSNPVLMKEISNSAMDEVANRFNLEDFSKAYNQVFNMVLNQKLVKKPLNITEFKVCKPYAKTWRRFVPSSIKILVRMMKEKRYF